MANVFISYARRDKERVARLTEALEGEGLSVWWDSDLVPGRRYRTIIAEQLAAADSVIVVWTAAALQSDWVQDEAEEARQRGVLIPVTLELVRPPAGFRQVQAADLSQWTGSPQHPDFRSLVFAVRSLVQVAEATRRTAAPPTPGQAVAAPEPVHEEPEPPREHPLHDPQDPRPTTDEATPVIAPPAAEPEPLAVPPPPVVEPALHTPTAHSATPEIAAAPPPASAGPVPPHVPPASPSLNGRVAAMAFRPIAWLAATAALVLTVLVLNGANHDSNPTPYFFAAPPLIAAALAGVSSRVGLGQRARSWGAWLSLIAGLLTVALIETKFMRDLSDRPANFVLVPFFFFVAAASTAFVLVAGVTLVVHITAVGRRRLAAQSNPQGDVRPAP